MNDLVLFVKSIWRHSVILLTGSAVVAILTFWEHWRGSAVKGDIFLGLTIFLFVWAVFRAWRDERRRAIAAEASKTSPEAILAEAHVEELAARFFALEELAGQLVEELASHRPFSLIVGPKLEEYRQVAGRFARYDDVRRAILKLQNTLDRMYVAKRDHEDDQEILRSELHSDMKKLLNACDHVTGRDKLHHARA